LRTASRSAERALTLAAFAAPRCSQKATPLRKCTIDKLLNFYEILWIKKAAGYLSHLQPHFGQVYILMDSIEPNSSAPDFTLPDQDEVEHTLSEYRGQWVLLYFYPKDDTPGCTKEACSIRDAFPRFESLNIKVLGVSIDSIESHKKFAKKYQLPFTLLSDTNKKVVTRYGVWGEKHFNFMGRENEGVIRSSFLIDPTGTIEKIYTDVKPNNHAAEVLRDLKRLEE
jgi:peroxiredoxin Q/BCP